MNARLAALALVAPLFGATQCKQSTAPATGTRTYRMGFAATPPRLEIASVLETIDTWRPRSDAALLALNPPWKAMLADTNPAVIVKRDQVELVKLYRSRGLTIVAMIDPTDGLARDKEAPELVAAGRSIREPAIQAMFREYAIAVDSMLHPDYLALAMETNLIRAAASSSVYDALKVMTASTAAALTARQTPATLYVSVQVETAWGRLPSTGQFMGIDADLRDFPFIRALGLSSYPFLGGFTEPEQVPLDYFGRLARASRLPVLVVEGGWSSGSVPGVVSSPERQARWISREFQLLDDAKAVGMFQITFTDLDLSSYQVPSGSILPLFAQLGLVDVNFQAKPALAEWDRGFTRRLLK
ncbi:MAG TPA: hypothetical protein VFT29_18375 [Gemmatimonadaceae bacterium]|nr:hypothetical protein [Gemmatimonadaceae bacterium]